MRDSPTRENLRDLGLSRRKALQMSASVMGASALAEAAVRAPSELPENALIVKPYVQISDSRALARERLTVMWHTSDRELPWQLRYRDAAAESWSTAVIGHNRVAVEGVAPHRVYRGSLAGLSPGRTVEYQLGQAGSTVFAARAKTRKHDSQATRMVVVADMGVGSPPQRQVAWQIHRYDPDCVVIPGDLVYNNGRISEYRPQFFPVYNQDRPTREDGAPLQRSIPFMGGLGQHDTGQPVDLFADGFAYYLYWSFPLNGPLQKIDDSNAFPLGTAASRRDNVLKAAAGRYPTMASYSFDYGNAHWVVLDSWNPHCNWNDNALRDWLRSDLRSAATATWKFVSCYLPPFNSSTAFPHTQKMRVIADILEQSGVDVVFSGYAHSFQRTYPLRFKPHRVERGPVRQPGHEIPGEFTLDRKFDGVRQTVPDGILYVTSGCGGNTELHSPNQTENPATWQPFTCRYHASRHQFTGLEIDGAELTLRQIDLDGNEIDRVMLTKPGV